MTEAMQAYCVKCKTKRVIANPEAVYTKTGTPGTRGACLECSTNLFRMGLTESHANVPKPEVVEAPQRKKKSTKKKASKKKGAKDKAPRRKGRLVIVESPAKARTVQRFLGKAYTVKASVGHVRDLLRSQLSVDTENDFKPKYRVPNEKRQVVKEIKAAAAKAEEIFLATDPDREGEAIAWHLMDAAEIEEKRARRVVFHEITEDAIAEAFSHPDQVNMDLVNAQQARRILDRLVGYSLTELLWQKVRNRLSAGRVQSVTLRLVVDREREIRTFVTEEYWSLAAELTKKGVNGTRPASFMAKLTSIDGHDIDFKSEADVKPHLTILERSAYDVTDVVRGTRNRRPSAPFTTSTLQQEASRRYNFNARRTMRVAQQLYEGIETDDGQVGLITYMRTDSTAIAKEAQEKAKVFILNNYGKEFAPKKPPIYKTRAKGAQEAHEAIRPTSINRTPESLKNRLSRDQIKLYTLIWQRFVASQMSNAVYTTQRVDIAAGPSDQPVKPYVFRVSGSLLKFQGFLRVYEEAPDLDAPADEETGRDLPGLEKSDRLALIELLPKQHFTQPPARYTEATLVRALEENGIGRPSTYAPTVAVIQNRDYVNREGKYLVPSETGFLVNDLLVEYFPEVFNTNFTADLEARLDRVAEGDQDWVPFLSEFYTPFEQQLEHARKHMPAQQQQETIGRSCPDCGSELVLRYGRFGKFIGCATYPECRYTEPWLEKIDVKCPKCSGDLVEKKTRRKRTFYGCVNYPDCDFTSWKRPLANPCPDCNGMLVETNRSSAQCTVCEHTFRRKDLPELADVTSDEE